MMKNVIGQFQCEFQSWLLKLVGLWLGLSLLACSPADFDQQNASSDINPIAQSSSDIQAQNPNEFQVAMASSAIATQILNSPQEQDILEISRQAKAVTASEVAEFQRLQELENQSASQIAEQFQQTNSSGMGTENLPPICQTYFQRVEQCFSKQVDSDGLLSLNDEMKLNLNNDLPDNQSCQLLNESFNAIAKQLNCD